MCFVKNWNGSRKWFVRMFFLLMLLAGGLLTKTVAQRPAVEQLLPSNSVVADSLISLIKAQLEQPGGDTAHYFMLQMVRNQCGAGNYDCCKDIYGRLSKEFSLIFNLPAVFIITQNLVARLDFLNRHKSIFSMN